MIRDARLRGDPHFAEKILRRANVRGFPPPARSASHPPGAPPAVAPGPDCQRCVVHCASPSPSAPTRRTTGAMSHALRGAAPLLLALLLAALLSCARAATVAGRAFPDPGAPVVTRDQLASRTGEGGGPIWTSVMGHVFDVTAGARVYGPGGMYHFFAGVDASRAFVTGDFEADLTDDLGPLLGDPAAANALADWVSFYARQGAQYPPVGVLGGGAFFDRGGAPTAAYLRLLAVRSGARPRTAPRRPAAAHRPPPAARRRCRRVSRRSTRRRRPSWGAGTWLRRWRATRGGSRASGRPSRARSPGGTPAGCCAPRGKRRGATAGASRGRWP